MEGTYKINTLGMISLAHEAAALADSLQYSASEVDTVQRLRDAHDTLISASALVLRHAEAEVPLAIADVVMFITDTTERVQND